jgi:integrase
MGYVEEQRAVGYKYEKAASALMRLDRLLVDGKTSGDFLSKDTVLQWIRKRNGETERNQNARVSLIRGLAKHMVRIGMKAYVFPGKATQVDRFNYTPYIFSRKELAKIFRIVDRIQPIYASPRRHLILPLLFRMLYGCGLRVSEALNLKTSDVDLAKGTLFIRQAKFGKERIVPISGSLLERCRGYSLLMQDLAPENQFFFPSPFGGRYTAGSIYEYFRNFLWKAGISHGGRGHGPRVHDLRHTFSVHCLEQWVRNGNDLTSLLPFLSAYLGHVDLRASQHYLRLTADLYPDIVSAVESNFSNLIPEVKSYEAD